MRTDKSKNIKLYFNLLNDIMETTKPKLLQLGTQVKVVKVNDETTDKNFIGSIGKVVDFTDNQIFHMVEFDLNTVPNTHPKYDKEAYIVENFYRDEIEVVIQ